MYRRVPFCSRKRNTLYGVYCFIPPAFVSIDSTLYYEHARKSLSTGPNRGNSVLAMHLRVENLATSVPYLEIHRKR
jgi:hypothetical protein